MIHSIKTRSTILFMLIIFIYCIVAINLYLIQIKQHDFYKKLAEQQYQVTITQTPSRGSIFDRTGHYLAINKNYIAAFLLPNQLTDEINTISFLQKYFPQAVPRLNSSRNKHFMFIKRRLSSQEIKIIKEEKTNDIFLLSEPGRYYPLACASPLIGLTDIDNKGILGLELLYNSVLAGKPTICHLEKDARSGYYYFKKETAIQGDAGHSIQLTIDADLQFLALEAVQRTITTFNAQEAAVLIMNPTNGEIITMLSYPYFDPNSTYTTQHNYFKNKIITDAYELGSVMKVCAAMAAIEEGVVTPDELIDCKNTKTTQVDGRIINTVKEHGIIPFCDVVAFSNNIGIALVSKRLGNKLYDHYKKLGFGQKTGIAFPGENSGYLNPPEKWSKQSIISLSYGYEVSTTLLQLACAFSIIATGYKVKPILIRPHSLPIPPDTSASSVVNAALSSHSVRPELVKPHVSISSHGDPIEGMKMGIKGNEQSKTNPLYSDETRNTIKEILDRTTLYGTAQRAKIKGCRIMSKTGTANMLINGKYTPEKNLYTCAGIIEKDNYQRVIVVFVKEAQQHNIYASTVAVPLFASIAEKMLIHDKIISQL